MGAHEVVAALAALIGLYGARHPQSPVTVDSVLTLLCIKLEHRSRHLPEMKMSRRESECRWVGR